VFLVHPLFNLKLFKALRIVLRFLLFHFSRLYRNLFFPAIFFIDLILLLIFIKFQECLYRFHDLIQLFHPSSIQAINLY